jgi:hypothetical protein
LWGFGCFGTGIASAEVVLRVAERPDGSGSGPACGPRPSGGANGAGGATTSAALSTEGGTDLEEELTRLGQAVGLRPGEAALRRAQAASDDEAMAALRAELAAILRSDVTTREALVGHAGRLGVDGAAYRAYLVARYRVEESAGPESSLSDEQLREERERFVRRYQDPAIAVRFRAQCERLDRRPAA